ncbi:MAG: hypothetical protein FWD03_08760 [Defluviitaleaceae bacterium]|nr:hypothetical protein [Defluviitaleaceae bacterium]
MPFYSYFEEVFLFLQTQHNNVIVMAIFIALHVLAIILRMITFIGYRGHNLMLAMDMHPSKALKAVSDTTSIRSPLLRRIVSDYVIAAEKNAPRVPLGAIVNKHVLALSLLGWRYSGIAQWIKKLDNGLVLLGLVLALIFPEYAMVYGLLAVIGFALLKFVASFFDFNTAKQLLIEDIHIYVEREVGQFFASHTAGAILAFKEEMAQAIDRQSVLLRGAVEKLSTDITPALNNLRCLENLPKAVENIQQSNDRYAVHHETFAAQGQLISKTQSALESSIAAYEATLQNLVQVMGSSMGTFIQMYGQTAADGLTAAMKEHMAHATKGNQETIAAVTTLFDQLTKQNSDISAHLRVLHEHISEI